jgi:hypothetical protein
MEQGGAAPRSTMLHKALYKYGSNFEAEKKHFERDKEVLLV